MMCVYIAYGCVTVYNTCMYTCARVHMYMYTLVCVCVCMCTLVVIYIYSCT